MSEDNPGTVTGDVPVAEIEPGLLVTVYVAGTPPVTAAVSATVTAPSL